MKKFRWNEDELQMLLKELPKIEDNRSPEQIFNNIKNRVNKQKKRHRWVPMAASTAAAFVLAALSIPYFMENETTESSSAESEFVRFDKTAETTITEQSKKEAGSTTGKTKEKPLQNNQDTNEKSTPAESETPTIAEEEPHNKENVIKARVVTSYAESVYPDRKEEQPIINMGVTDVQANYYIPLSLAANSVDSKENVAGLNELSSYVNEKAYGISNPIPPDVKITTEPDERHVIVDFPANSTSIQYDSQIFSALQQSLKYTDKQSVTFSIDGQLDVEFPHLGQVTDRWIEKEEKKAFYVYQASEDAPGLLVPSNISFNTPEEAMLAMKSNPDGQQTILASIPSELVWNAVTEDGNKLIIDLSPESAVENVDALPVAIEAILLTAKDFGKETVLFKNPPIESIGSFDLTNEITVPVAPNLITGK
ncbi:GerMN domain-containing protein [Peribacillus sp. SCS-155]|uniref:GerMN domain-containing protein n=1 Tax=Peribacillus sedimenti TaxID=3115297 RepID=UPI003905D07C